MNAALCYLRGWKRIFGVQCFFFYYFFVVVVVAAIRLHFNDVRRI